MRNRSIGKKIVLGILLFLVFVIVGMVIDVLLVPAQLPEETLAAQLYVESHHLPQPPHAFTHDGCSLFPDSVLGHDFRAACLTHDITYWAGGSLSDKDDADLALYNDLEKSGPLGASLFAPLMYTEVQYLGTSALMRAIDANWSYGWNSQ